MRAPALMDASGLRRSWPSHRDELLAQLRCFVLALQPLLCNLACGFRKFARSEELLFVAAAVGRSDERQADGEGFVLRVSPFLRVGDHLQRLPVGLDHVDSELLERPLHPQKRRDVRLVVDAPCHREEVAEALSDHLVGSVAAPATEGPIHVFDPPAGLSVNVDFPRTAFHGASNPFDKTGCAAGSIF